MNIQLHRLEEPETLQGSQDIMNHNLWLRELEEQELEAG